ncbi:hypothetical protein CC2G_002118 [Coprinopsis cinerea AmutBmut pab1-1]|nr:hypothetical protein CC2G_002118 [Coprinopsis cinerea AmutBmut pab1-1]
MEKSASDALQPPGSDQRQERTHFPLYYDVLLRSLEFFRGDYGALYRFSLVNKDFNRAASTLLYSRVVLSPPPSHALQINLKDAGAITSPSNLPSALLPKYKAIVVELEISGYLSPRPPPRNTLHATISNAVSQFANLSSIKFTPNAYHGDVFVDSLNQLPELSCLQSLDINSSCMDEDYKVRHLIKIKGLRKLMLRSPGRAILQVLPDWLGKMQRTLMELHLLDNCGSVTPGVLKAFLPHACERLKAFSLGLSYSLTDTDVFVFVDQLSSLERLQLRHYYQIRPPSHRPRLRKLKEFTAVQTPEFTAAYAASVGSWIRQIVSASPLQTLRIITEGVDEDQEERRVCPSYEGLLNHLTKKHLWTLRHLFMKDCLVTLKQLPVVFENCISLESIHVSVDKRAPTLLAEKIPIPSSLNSMSLEVRNTRDGEPPITEQEVNLIMKRGDMLRHLSVNGTYWEAHFQLSRSSEDECSLVVEEVEPSVPPWSWENDS